MWSFHPCHHVAPLMGAELPRITPTVTRLGRPCPPALHACSLTFGKEQEIRERVFKDGEQSTGIEQIENQILMLLAFTRSCWWTS